MEEQRTTTTRRLRFLRRGALWGGLGLGLAACAVALLLQFGNPQWHKYVYLFQSLSGDPDGRMPSNYTGVWRSWRADGWKMEETYCNGVREGRVTCWNGDGHIYWEAEFRGGDRDGPELYWWSETGQLGRFSYYRNDKMDGPDIEWDSTGRLLCNGVHKDGRPWAGTFFMCQDMAIVTFQDGKEVARVAIQRPR